MDRRTFLRGLIAAATVTSVSRVYSFPTEIVIVPARRTLPQATVKYYEKRFCTNLSGLMANRSYNVYKDYVSYSELALYTTIDPAVLGAAKEMAFNLGKGISGVFHQ